MAGTKMIISPMTPEEKKTYDEKIAAMSDEDRKALFAKIAEMDCRANKMVREMRENFGQVTLQCSLEDIEKFLISFELVPIDINYMKGLITLKLKESE